MSNKFKNKKVNQLNKKPHKVRIVPQGPKKPKKDRAGRNVEIQNQAQAKRKKELLVISAVTSAILGVVIYWMT